MRTGLVRLRVNADDPHRRALTRRELQVLSLVASGGTRESIGRELGMASDTVASHITRIYRALGARNAAHAVALAHGYGMISAKPISVVPFISRQERSVLAGLASGLTSEQVAAHLSLSVDTVKTHRRRLYRKLGVSCRANAVDTAIRGNLLAVVVETGGANRPNRAARMARPPRATPVARMNPTATVRPISTARTATPVTTRPLPTALAASTTRAPQRVAGSSR